MHVLSRKTASRAAFYLAGLSLALSTGAMSAKVSAKDAKFVFDVDGVLLQHPKYIRSKTIIKNLDTIIKSLRPSVIKKYRKLRKKNASSTEIIREFEKIKHHDLAAMIRHIAHSKIPIEGMVELLKELKQRGYELHIATNMSLEDLAFYQKKYPGLFSHFDEFFSIDYLNTKKPFKKPDTRYFEEYRAQYPSDKECIFIDDKHENCRSSGFEDTIVFINASQLRAELVARGAL